MIQTFAGYDPASPTLQRSPLFGDCMRGIIPAEYRTCYADRAAPIASGDFVRLWTTHDDGEVQVIVKRLHVSRAGTWWGECTDGIFQIGTLVRPFAIEKVVAFDTEALVRNTNWPRRPASAEEAAHFAMLAEDVVREWHELGHADGVPFPGLARLNYFLPGTFGTPNPDYRPPEPL